jgi:hypothetical protein
VHCLCGGRTAAPALAARVDGQALVEPFDKLVVQPVGSAALIKLTDKSMQGKEGVCERGGSLV